MPRLPGPHIPRGRRILDDRAPEEACCCGLDARLDHVIHRQRRAPGHIAPEPAAAGLRRRGASAAAGTAQGRRQGVPTEGVWDSRACQRQVLLRHLARREREARQRATARRATEAAAAEPKQGRGAGAGPQDAVGREEGKAVTGPGVCSARRRAALHGPTTQRGGGRTARGCSLASRSTTIRVPPGPSWPPDEEALRLRDRVSSICPLAGDTSATRKDSKLVPRVAGQQHVRPTRTTRLAALGKYVWL